MRDPVDASRLDNTHVRLAERMCDDKFPLTYLRDAVRHSIHTGILSAKSLLARAVRTPSRRWRAKPRAAATT